MGPLIAICLLHIIVMQGCWCRRFSFRVRSARFWSDSSRRIYCIRGAARSIRKHGAAQIRHGACGPPGVAEAVEQADALLEFFGGTVDVDFKAAGAEVAVYDAEGDAEGVGDDGKGWEELGGFGVEEVDDAGGGEGLADVGG